MDIPSLLLRCANDNKNNKAIVDGASSYTYADILHVAAYIQTLSQVGVLVAVITRRVTTRRPVRLSQTPVTIAQKTSRHVPYSCGLTMVLRVVSSSYSSSRLR